MEWYYSGMSLSGSGAGLRREPSDGHEVARIVLARADVGYQLELYRGARHGFTVPDNPSYDQAAANRHWSRLTTLFAETLDPA